MKSDGGLTSGPNDRRDEIYDFIDTFSDAIRSNRAAVFIGSGFSYGYYPSWKEFLDPFGKQFGVDDDSLKLSTKAQYCFNNGGEEAIRSALKNVFSSENRLCKEDSSKHRCLLSLPINEYWTTNYDPLIEDHLGKLNFKFDTIVSNQSYKNRIFKDVRVFKLHGSYDKPQFCVISDDDYKKFPKGREILTYELKASLCTKTFLYLGYSFSDSDIQRLIDELNLLFENGEGGPLKGYWIVTREGLNKNKVDSEINNRVKNFKRMNIAPVIVDDYGDVDGILERLRKKVNSKRVFISGSYMNPDDASSEITKGLVKKLVEEKYEIFNGYGLNIGQDVIAGAFDAAKKDDVRYFDKTVHLFPMPRRTKNKKEVYSEIREVTAERSSVAIFIGEGNPKKDPSSDGMLEEYEKAKSVGNLVIPVAVSGGISRIIWEKEKENLNDFWKSHFNQFETLSSENNPNKIVNVVMEILEDYEQFKHKTLICP